MSSCYLPESALVGTCDPIGIFLLKFSCGPCQDRSSESSAGQSRTQYFLVLDQRFNQGVKFGTAVLEKLTRTPMRIRKERAQFSQGAFFCKPVLKRAYPFLFPNDVEGPLSNVVRQVRFRDHEFVRMRQAG